MDNVAKYAKHLGSLEGNAFQSAVCRRLESCILDFQRVPDRPHGDGGLDGISHRQTCGYCCYGPVQLPFKSNTRGLKADIVKKFKSDLRTLFELRTKRKGLVPSETPELHTILGAGTKLKALFLIVSVFNDHRIIGPLNTYLEKCKGSSRCRYVAEDATLTVWGPESVADRGPVDDLMLRRLEQQAMLARTTKVADSAIEPQERPEEFDSKFDWLVEHFPARQSKIDQLRSALARDWTRAVLLDQELANSSASLHQILGQIRRDVLVDASLLSASDAGPFDMLAKMRVLLAERFRAQAAEQLAVDLIHPLADGEVARLIGECPIDWRT